MTPPLGDDHLSRTACRLFASYGREAAFVAYTKAACCEADSSFHEARQWRAVLGRLASIEAALCTVPPAARALRH